MRIQIKSPTDNDLDETYKTVIDTEVMDVEITEAFKGPGFTSVDGERLVVIQRDSGFELSYQAPGISNPVGLELKNGDVIVERTRVYNIVRSQVGATRTGFLVL